MKKALFLAIVTLLASQLLLAHYPPSQTGKVSDNSVPDNIAAAFSELPENDTTTGFSWGKATSNTSAAYHDHFLPSVKDTVYHLEFEAEKGITLPGASAVELLNHAPCLNLDIPALTHLNNNYRILVFINDQPTSIRETNVSAALRQIPAERIKAIDIRNAPADISDPEEEANIIIRVTKVK